MKQATPAIQELARHLLAIEANESERREAAASATLSALAKLHVHLTKLVGAAGFQALLSRALALAKLESPWLEPVRVQTDATFAGFSEAAQQQPADKTAEGCATLVAMLLGLLVTFIGEALMLRIVQDIWSEARLDNTNSGAGERSE